MTGLEYFDHRERLWCVIPLYNGNFLSREDRSLLIGNVLDRYYDFQDNGKKALKKSQVRVKGTDFDATIKSDGKYYTIGCLAGRYFYGTIEHEKGKSELSFLVMEPIDASLN